MEKQKEKAVSMKDFFEKLKSVCRYRCAKIGGTYKCSKGKNFAEDCDLNHCPVAKIKR